MHTKPMADSEGRFGPEKPTAAENPDFKCSCGSNNVWYRSWESSCGGYDDYKYHCRDCNKTWWVEGADA
jgi:hypothetical protein